jgi:hypothetical protein
VRPPDSICQTILKSRSACLPEPLWRAGHLKRPCCQSRHHDRSISSHEICHRVCLRR